MNAAEIKKILTQLDIRPSRRLGQNFLIDNNILKKIVDAAEIKPGNLVLEIGPGLGVLTQALLDRGAEVVAIEKDRRFVDYLSTTPTLIRANRRIVQGDAVKMDWSELIDGPSAPLRAGRPWKFVSNLPYSITSLALRKALYAPNPPSLMVVLVQKEVAERVIASGAKQSLLSLMVALSSKSVKILSRVSPNSFYPIPKVESAILKIVPMTQAEREKKWGIEPEEIMKVARLGFAHPRKLLSSNLKSLQVTGSRLQALGIKEKARAEDLSLADWARLSKILS